MSELVIRPAVAADRESWIRLRFALWPDCPPDKQRIEIEQLLASDGVVLLADDPAVGPVEREGRVAPAERVVQLRPALERSDGVLFTFGRNPLTRRMIEGVGRAR